MKNLLAIALIFFVFAATGRTIKSTSADNDSKNINITGAGATFPMPFYNQLIADYSTKTDKLVTYRLNDRLPICLNQENLLRDSLL